MPRFELRQELVEIGDVPGSLDLGQHDDVELAPDRADDLDHVVERPRAVERIHARPQAGRAEVGRLGHLDEAGASGFLGVGRDCVLEIAEHDVDLFDEIRHFGAEFFEMRRHEMNHPLDLGGRFAQRRRGADGERTVELIGKFHLDAAPKNCVELSQMRRLGNGAICHVRKALSRRRRPKEASHSAR